jgi:outer membrane protein assembly factor BamB
MRGYDMKRSIGILSGLLVLLLVLAPATTVADSMYRADPQRTGVFTAAGNAPENTLKWTFDKKNHPITSPVVSDGTVFFGSEDANLYALYAVNGSEKWHFSTGGMIRSAPAVSGGLILFGSGDRKIYALYAANGTMKWSHATGGDGVGYSSPAVSDGTVFILAYDRKMYALDAATGSEKWTYSFSSLYGSESESSPAVSGGIVYFGDINRNFTALYASNGTVKWQRHGPEGMSIIPPGTPVVSNGVVYSGGSGYHNMTALYAENGTEKFRLERGYTNWQLVSPAVENGMLYTGGADSYIYAVNAVTREQVWTFSTGQFLRGSPSLSGGVLYAVSPTHVFAIWAANGTQKWSYDPPSPAGLWGSPVIANGTVYVDGDRLYAIGSTATTPTYFTGHVYSGEVGNVSKGLRDIPVYLYSSSSPTDLGVPVTGTVTDSYGYYQFVVPIPAAASYYNIIATDPVPGSSPTGAGSTSGTVKNSSWIQYSTPLTGKDLGGNNFWDFVPTVHGDFTGVPRSGPVPLTVRFTDNSTGFPVTWNWVPDYNTTTNNGFITCTSPNCTYTYTVPGVYHVQMRIFNAVSSDWVTRLAYINATAAPVVIPLPGQISAPMDPDGDGLYEDLSGNGAAGFQDVVLFFRNIDWIAENEPVSAFDFSGNGGIGFQDVVQLFREV